MAASDDLKSLAASTKVDYYELLEISPASDSEAIRRAYRKTALKYHPDKVGANNTTALEKFHLLQIANDVLSTPELKDLYDNARRARDQIAQRDHQLSARRREMKEDLERREREGANVKLGKRKSGSDDEFEKELQRLREDTKRRRVELDERRRREMEELLREEGVDGGNTVVTETMKGGDGVEEMDRSIKVRFRSDDIDRQTLVKIFERFGAVEDVVIRSKAAKDSSTKKKRPRRTALLVYKSVVGAHAAISDYPKLVESEGDTFGQLESVDWASGREPAFVPRAPVLEETKEGMKSSPALREGESGEGEVKSTRGGSSTPKISFKGAKNDQSGASVDEIMMMRLKNAEKRRQEVKMRKEKAAEGAE